MTNNFKGSIEGKNINSYYSQLNWKAETVSDAIENTKEALNIIEIDGTQFSNDKFWNEIFEQKESTDNEEAGRINLILDKEADLYSDSNVAQLLEAFGTNILEKDKKKDSKDKYIKTYYQKELNNRIDDQFYTLQKINQNVKDDEQLENRINEVNYKLVKGLKKIRQKTNNKTKYAKQLYDKYKDRKEVVDYYKVFQEYQKLRKKLQAKEKLSSDEKRKLRFIRNQSYKLIEDIEDVASKNFINFKQPLPDNNYINIIDNFDFTNKDHVKRLLYIQKKSGLTDIGLLQIDLENIISELNLNSEQKELIKLIPFKTQEELSDIFGVKQRTISKRIDSIAQKVAKKSLKNIS